MKKLIFIIVFLFGINLFAQVEFPKNWKGNYLAATLYTGTNVSAAGTSNSLTVPFEVKQAIFYLDVTSVSTADTLKNIYIQGSPDGTNWYNITQTPTFNNVTAAGKQRVVATLVDRYIRLYFEVAGTSVAINFTVKVTPK